MKLLYTTLLLFIMAIPSKSQQFLWAQSYDISNCNEVAALAVSENNNIFTCGVHDASNSLPYTGNCYISKTDSVGWEIWTNYIYGNIQIGDMAAVGNSIVIIGQSNAPFTYQDEQYGLASTFMFIIKIDSTGSIEWYYFDEEKYGANTNIDIGDQENIALQVRGQYNLGDWIMIMDPEGNIVKSREISTTQTILLDIAYYDERVYLNGGFFAPDSILIDTVLLELPAIENATFVLALNQDLVAEWASVKSTINNRDGRIEANASGVFAYAEILLPPFNIVNTIRKFSFEGEILAQAQVPVFTNAISLYPDIRVTPTMLGIFVNNDFGFNSHKLVLFDHDLNLLSEKIISGASDLYSGQIANKDDDIFVSHVYSGNLSFNSEITLPYSGSGKLPYIAKIDSPSITGLSDKNIPKDGFIVYPNPADKIITISFDDWQFPQSSLDIYDLRGNMVGNEMMYKNITTIDISHIPSGIYFIKIILPDKRNLLKKIIIR